jgi:hypothetical protein
MLCATDEGLVRRDPEVPGLGLLLDADGFAEALAEAYPHAQVTGVTPRYIRYKPGTSCLVGYVARCAAGEIEMYARAHSAQTDQKLEKAAQRESVPSALGDGIRMLPERSIVIYPFPNDHELAAIQWLDLPARRREMLEHLLPQRADLWEGELQPLRYKPERRFVAKLTGGRGSVVLKAYTRQDYQVRKDNVGMFRGLGALRVPRCVGRSSRHHLAAIEWLEGRSLRDVLVGGAAPRPPATAAGAALARVHDQKPHKVKTFWTAENYARQLADSARALAEIAPDLGERAGRIAGAVGTKLLQRHWRGRRGIHGDLSADHVVIQERTVGILDFDRAAYGDPRMDLGSFGARLECDVIEGALPAHVAEETFAALLDAYRAESVKDVTRKVGRFVAASLLQLAAEPFRRRREDWPQAADRILARAEELADGRGGD